MKNKFIEDFNVSIQDEFLYEILLTALNEAKTRINATNNNHQQLAKGFR